MVRIFAIVFAVHLVGGAVFFGVLYSAALPVSTKILCGLSAALVGVAWWASVVEKITAFSFQLRTAELLLVAIREANEISATRPGLEDLKEHLNQATNTGARGREWSLFRYGIGMLMFWLLSGYVVYSYLP